MSEKGKELEQLLEQSRELAKKSLSESTLHAYDIDFRIFEDWALEHGVSSLPACSSTIEAYIAACRSRDVAVSTLSRYLTSIRKKHAKAGSPNPTNSEGIKATIRGYRRVKGLAQKQAKPIAFDQLVRMVEQCGSSIKGLRDAAILTVGWCGALRRSEIVALNREDIDSVPEGIVLKIRSSKTDQEKKGRSIGIPFGSDRFCPVQIIRRWYTVAQIAKGPLFPAIFRGADKKIFATFKRRDRGLSDGWIAKIVKACLEQAGYDSRGFSGHSLRAGFCTQAAKAGVPEWAIMNHTGHTSERTLHGYIREGELFSSNPLSVVLGTSTAPLPELPALEVTGKVPGDAAQEDRDSPPKQLGG